MVIFYELYVGKRGLWKVLQLHAFAPTLSGNRRRSYHYPKSMQGMWPSPSCWEENAHGSQILLHTQTGMLHCNILVVNHPLDINVFFRFHSRFVKIWRVERLRVGGCVCVERVAVVESVRLPRSLVLGKVPASGELGLQSLWGGCKQREWWWSSALWKDRGFLHGSEREIEIRLLDAWAQKKQWLTPTFRSKSLTMLRADILAEGVSGELLPYPFDRATGGERAEKKMNQKTTTRCETFWWGAAQTSPSVLARWE